eukprot:1283005-Alexandrium_andersonii.AAC.1
MPNFFQALGALSATKVQLQPVALRDPLGSRAGVDPLSDPFNYAYEVLVLEAPCRSWVAQGLCALSLAISSSAWCLGLSCHLATCFLQASRDRRLNARSAS